MSESRAKRSHKQRFLAENPFCCFCGGNARATTVDHVPSIQMFSLRLRPQGLEVPACRSCNQVTRQHEQVAAILGRVYPDGRTEAERDETTQIMRHVQHNNPGLFDEMLPSARQHTRFAA